MKLFAIAERAVPFVLGLTVGVLPAWFFAPVSEVPAPVVFENATSGRTYCNDKRKFKKKAYHRKPVEETQLTIDSKPIPGYTDAARRENIEGMVKLRVEFRADGTVGEIGVIEGLPAGLTEKAIDAAKKIKFEPAEVDGVPVPSTKLIEYTFAIY